MITKIHSGAYGVKLTACVNQQEQGTAYTFKDKDWFDKHRNLPQKLIPSRLLLTGWNIIDGFAVDVIARQIVLVNLVKSK